MANESGIEWLAGPNGEKGLTVNPVVGCERISPGCGGGYIKGPNGESGGCWAEHLVSTRMSKNPKLPLYKDLAREGGGWSGVVRLMPDRLADIVALGRRKKGSRVFVCDMSDLFHKDVPFEYIAAVWGAMACAPNHLFYVLTKRPARALEWMRWCESGLDSNGAPASWFPFAIELGKYGHGCPDELRLAVAGHPLHPNRATARWPLPNVVFGVTVEDRRYGVPRLDLARQFPARWRFASVEPQLEDLGDVDWRGFDLLVQGGEAGDGARPFDLAWARKVRDQARRDGVRYFQKQGGDFVCDLRAFEWKLGESCDAPAWRLVDSTGRPAASVWLNRDLNGHNWHTWDVRGIGGENACAETIEKSKDEAEASVVRQRFHRVTLGKKGNDLARLPEDLRIRENIPMPGAPQ